MDLMLVLTQDDLAKVPLPVTPDQRDCLSRICQRILFPCLAVQEKPRLNGLLYNCGDAAIIGMVPTKTEVIQFPEIPHDCFPLHFLIYHRTLANKPDPASVLRHAKSLLVSYGCLLLTLPIHEKEPTDSETQYWLTPRQWNWLVKRHGFTVLDQEVNTRLDMFWIAAQVSL